MPAVEFGLHCDCGKDLVVTEGSAGASIRCDCGRPVEVPGLKELRTLAGLPAYDPSPELVIEQMLASGELPLENECIECGVSTNRLLRVKVECERVWKRRAYAGCLAFLFGGLSILWAVSRM